MSKVVWLIASVFLLQVFSSAQNTEASSSTMVSTAVLNAKLDQEFLCVCNTAKPS